MKLVQMSIFFNIFSKKGKRDLYTLLPSRVFTLPCRNKWSWGESNPCPKVNSLWHLPLQSLFYHSLCHPPNDRLMVSVASSYAHTRKALRMSFPT